MGSRPSTTALPIAFIHSHYRLFSTRKWETKGIRLLRARISQKPGSSRIIGHVRLDRGCDLVDNEASSRKPSLGDPATPAGNDGNPRLTSEWSNASAHRPYSA